MQYVRTQAWGPGWGKLIPAFDSQCNMCQAAANLGGYNTCTLDTALNQSLMSCAILGLARSVVRSATRTPARRAHTRASPASMGALAAAPRPHRATIDLSAAISPELSPEFIDG